MRSVVTVRLRFHGQTEIGNLHTLVLIDQYVASGQIAVQDFHAAQILHAAGNVFGEHHQLMLGENGRLRMEVHEKRSMLDVLHDDRLGVLNVRNDLHDIPMLQHAHYPDFTLKVGRHRERRVERFHRDFRRLALVVFQLPAIHNAVVALADLTL